MYTNIKQTAFIIACAIVAGIFLTACKKTEVFTPPTNVRAMQMGSLIFISWKNVPQATTYRIYRSATGTDYMPVGTASKSGYNNEGYADGNAFEGWNYYKVTAFTGNVESEASYVSFNFIPQPNPPRTPANVTAESKKPYYQYISVSWTLVDGATGYKVYRSDSPSGGFYWLKNIDKNDYWNGKAYYSDHSPLKGENFYKITAFNAGGESNPSGSVGCKF